MKLFALSDHHFGHQNIIKYCNRKISAGEAAKIGHPNEIPSDQLSASLDAMSMIQAHNEVVGDDDLVIFGGDVAASPQGRKWFPKILPKMKGRKILIRGNHDHLKSDDYLKLGFSEVHDALRIGDFMFCHYPDIPMIVDICQKENLTLCCGHTHKPFPNYGDNVNRINLACDVAGRTPIFLGNLS